MGGSCCKDENLETNKEVRNVSNKPIFSHAENLPPRSE